VVSSTDKGYRFPREIIAHCMWLYHRFSLPFRDIELLMAKRGIEVTCRQPAPSTPGSGPSTPGSGPSSPAGLGGEHLVRATNGISTKCPPRSVKSESACGGR
jgi:hypothetical protein